MLHIFCTRLSISYISQYINLENILPSRSGKNHIYSSRSTQAYKSKIFKEGLYSSLCFAAVTELNIFHQLKDNLVYSLNILFNFYKLYSLESSINRISLLIHFAWSIHIYIKCILSIVSKLSKGIGNFYRLVVTLDPSKFQNHRRIYYYLGLFDCLLGKASILMIMYWERNPKHILNIFMDN